MMSSAEYYQIAAENLRIATMWLRLGTDVLIVVVVAGAFYLLCLFVGWLDSVLPPTHRRDDGQRFWEGNPRPVGISATRISRPRIL